MKLTEKALLENLIRERKPDNEQYYPLDDWNLSCVGTREVLTEKGFKEIPNKVYWRYARKYAKDDFRTAHLCERVEADCICIDDVDAYRFIELDIQ